MKEETQIRKIQEEMHGDVNKPMTENEVGIKIMASRNVMKKDFLAFQEDPTSHNLTELKFAMYWYQYWMNKATYEEVEC